MSVFMKLGPASHIGSAAGGSAAVGASTLHLHQLESVARDLGTLRNVVGPGACVGEQEIVLPSVSLPATTGSGGTGANPGVTGGAAPSLRKRGTSVLAVNHVSMLQIPVEAVSGYALAWMCTNQADRDLPLSGCIIATAVSAHFAGGPAAAAVTTTRTPPKCGTLPHSASAGAPFAQNVKQ
jgi:hypothetical protein